MAMDAVQLSNMIAAMTGRPDDPTVKGLAQLLATALRDDDEPEVETRAAIRARRRRAAMHRVAHIQRLFQSMSDRNAFVAAALGACECWGADADCDRCHGRGAPGAFEPDAAAFEVIVLPMVRRRPQLFHALSNDAPTVGAPTHHTEP